MRCHWSLWLVGALAVLGAFFINNVGVCAQDEHGEGGGESPGVDEITGETTQICTSSVETLTKEVRIAFSKYDTTINCFAFGQERRLERGVVSLFQSNGTSVGRYELTCRSNTIKVERLMGQNASHVEHTACLECAPTSADEICQEPCSSECEKCAYSVDRILCTECHMYHLLNSYPPRSTPTAEQIKSDRERNEEAGREEVCRDNPTLDQENPLNFHCVSECPDRGNHSAPSEKEGRRTCFACGIEYCVECERSEGQGGLDECRVCLADTILFDGRCYSCPDALIARTAILQKAEEEREELATQRMRQIKLAIALPTVSIIIIMIVFIIAISIYAYHRYRHRSLSADIKHGDTHRDLS